MPLELSIEGSQQPYELQKVRSTVRGPLSRFPLELTQAATHEADSDI